jgi:hypothetical protein
MTESVSPIASSAVTAYAKGIKPLLFVIMINSFFIAIFLSLLTSLCYSSSSTLRRRPVFGMNVGALILGTALAAMSNHIQVRTVLCYV